MSDENKVHAPSAAEIEKRFRGPLVRSGRPIMRAGLNLTRLACGYRWSGVNTDRLREMEQPFILASNHCSHADTAAIIATLPQAIREHTCVAAALDVFGAAPRRGTTLIKALWRELLQWWIAASFHAFAFDRHGSPLRSLRTATDLIRSGWNLLLYPEGTRSRTSELGAFKSGVGVLARSTGRPVIPVYVEGGATILPCGATIPRSGLATVMYGEPMFLKDGESAQEFTDRVQAEVRKLAQSKRLRAAHRVAARAQRHDLMHVVNRVGRQGA